MRCFELSERSKPFEIDRRRLALGGSAFLTSSVAAAETRKALHDVVVVESRLRIADLATGAATALLTLGYAEAGDGGGALYTSITAGPAKPLPWIVRSRDGAWFALAEKRPCPAMFGARPGTIEDVSGAIQDALDFGAQIVDCRGYVSRIARSIIVGKGQSLLDVNFEALTPGMNMVLVSSGSRVSGRLRGTGATQIIERGVYPAHEGAHDVVLDVEVCNLTVGVHAKPLSPNGETPRGWRMNVVTRNIVGEDGESEGYGILLSPANGCTGVLHSYDTQRHALYISSGASDNTFDVYVDGCNHGAVQIYAKENQPWCERNRVRCQVRRCRETPKSAGYSAAAGIYQKSRNNHVTIEVHSDDETTFAARVEGVGTSEGPHPRDNVFVVNATGVYRGDAVVYSSDAINTMIVDPFIQAKAKKALIAFEQNQRTFHSLTECAGEVRGGCLDGCDGTNKGVLINTTTAPVSIRGETRFSNVEPEGRISAQVSDMRKGVGKIITAELRISGLAGGLTSNISQKEFAGFDLENARIVAASAIGLRPGSNAPAANCSITAEAAFSAGAGAYVRVVNNGAETIDASLHVVFVGD
jgi:hypothetical protein